MTDLPSYLTPLFLAYFPDATAVNVAGAEETIEVTLTFADSEPRVWTMNIGSDDNWFAFTSELTGYTITMPLMPDEPAKFTAADILRHELHSDTPVIVHQQGDRFYLAIEVNDEAGPAAHLANLGFDIVGKGAA